jgi:hypothetical protein
MTARTFLVAALLLGCSGQQAPTPAPADPTGTAPAPGPDTPGEPPSPTTPPPGDEGAGTAPCKPTGCSGIVCSDEEVMTTCEYRPEYACYKSATCTRQPDGACGWTETPELEACLKNPPPE